MRKKRVCIAAVVSAICLAFFLSSSARARPPYNREFASRYLKPGSKLASTLGNEKSCYFCHTAEKHAKYTRFGKAFRQALGTNAAPPDAIKFALDEAVKQVGEVKDGKPVPYSVMIEDGTMLLGR